MDFSLTNDSFDNEHQYINTGCLNEPMYDSTNFSFSQNIYLKIKSKKNNIMDSSVQHFILKEHIVNEFEERF